MRFHAAALPFLASGVGADFVVQVRSFQPAPSGARAAVGRAVDDAHRACFVDVDVRGLCRPSDPFEEFFRGSPIRSFFDSDPFFRNDPFMRLAATPPSASESPRILDQVFGDQISPPPQVRVVHLSDMEDFTSLFNVLDGMMDSAMRMALTPPSTMQRMEINQAPQEDCADTAVSLLDSMVDGLIDHTASASASASDDAQENQEEAEAPAEPHVADEDAGREEAEREDIVHARSGRTRPSNDDGEAPRYEPEAPASVAEAEVRSPSPADPLHPTWDPVVLARKIAQHGRDILADEEEKTIKAGADGDLRRRLSEEDEVKSEVRRRMARRLTEVVPFGHLTVVPRMMPSPMFRRFSDAEEDLSPRLGFGSQVDRCLWSLHREEEGAALSNACSEALEVVEQSLRELRKEETGFVQGAPIAPEAPAEEKGVLCRLTEFLQLHFYSFWVLWASLATMLLALTCLFGDDDEDDDEEYGDASDYVLVEDNSDVDADEGRDPAGAVAFVGVPIRVV